jgi:hypothetical protein
MTNPILIENWWASYNKEKTYLNGYTSNHPRWPTVKDKPITTSSIIGRTSDNLIKTNSGSIYRLGKAGAFQWEDDFLSKLDVVD